MNMYIVPERKLPSPPGRSLYTLDNEGSFRVGTGKSREIFECIWLKNE
jgi:hypothetical protein